MDSSTCTAIRYMGAGGTVPHPLAPHLMPRTTPRGTRPPQSPAGVVVALTPYERIIVRASIALKLARLDETHASLANTDELTAHRIIREYHDYLRLLDDLGWTVHDPRPEFPLTMPADVLGRVLVSLADQDPAVAAVCDALLERLP